MEADVVKQFSQELASLYEAKPPVSKAKMVQITKLAIKGIKYYKHIVMSVEKFIHKCKAEYKLPGLYVVDSIVRQSRHQFGADKDLFAPRFAKNIVATFQSFSQAVDEDKPKILRVLHLWLQNGVFTEDVLQPVIDLAASFAIGENNVNDNELQVASDKPKRPTANSPKLTQDNRQDLKNSTTPPLELRPQRQSSDISATTASLANLSAGGDHSNLDPGFLQQIQKLTSTLMNQQKIAADSERRLTKKILADYDYSDEDSGDEGSSDKGAAPSKEIQNEDITANLAAAAQNLLNNPQLLQQIQQMQKSMRNPTSMVAPPSVPVIPTLQQHPSISSANRMPMHPTIPPAPANMSAPPPPFNAGHHFPPANFSMPPPNYSIPPPSVGVVEQHPPPPVVPRQIDSQAMNYPPPAEPLPPGFENQRHLDTDDRRRQRGLDSKRRKSRERSRSRSRSRGEKKRKRKSRSRSGSPSRGRHRRNRSRSTERRNREKERERERRGLPPLKTRHISICSRTLWFGRVPTYCEQEEIKQAVKEYGEPVSIDLIPPRGCAYVVMPDRKSAFKVLDRLKDLRIQNRNIKMAWAPGKGVKKAYNEEWDAENGVTYVVYDKLPQDLTPFLDGGMLDVDSLPENLRSVYDENGKIGTTGLPQQIPVPQSVMPPTAMMTPIPYPHFPTMPGYPSPMAPPYGPPLMSTMPASGQLSSSPMLHRLPAVSIPPPQANLHNVPIPQMGIPSAPGTPISSSLQQPPTFGVRMPTPVIAGGHTIPSLLSSSPIVEQQRYPYPAAVRTPSSPYRGRGRGGFGGGGARSSWGDDVSSEQQQQHSNYERNNYRGRGGGGFGGQGRGSGYYQRGSGGGQQHSSRFNMYDSEAKGFTPENEGSSSIDDRIQSFVSHDSSMDASSDDVQSGGGGAASRRKSRWGSTPSYVENSVTMTTNDHNTSNLFDTYAVGNKTVGDAVEDKQEIVSTENVAMVESESENETEPREIETKIESEQENKRINDSSYGDMPTEPIPGPPPETVTEEREVNEDGDRYDQRGLGMLLKMMNNP